MSPIAFSGLKVADVGLPSVTAGGLVSMLVAFEPGIFWQTILTIGGNTRQATLEASAAGATS